MTLKAADVLPVEQIQFFGETQTEQGNKTFFADNTTITYVEGANTGFAFNFSGESCFTSQTGNAQPLERSPAGSFA